MNKKREKLIKNSGKMHKTREKWIKRGKKRIKRGKWIKRGKNE